jgi:replicative DNA helicase
MQRDMGINSRNGQSNTGTHSRNGQQDMDTHSRNGNLTAVTPAPLGSYIPPHNIEAEMSTLGSILIAPEILDTIRAIVRPMDFYRTIHNELYDVICSLADRSIPVDLLTVQDELKRRHMLDTIGGMSYLTALFDTVPTAANAEYHAKMVVDKAIARAMASAGRELVQLALQDAGEMGESVDAAEQIVFGIRRDTVGSGGVSIYDLGVRQYQQSIDNSDAGSSMLGLPTGFGMLDHLSGGLKRKEMTIIGARPSLGKTSLGAAIAMHAAVVEKIPTLFISIEMSAEAIAMRCYSSRARIESKKLLLGKLDDDEWSRYSDAICDMDGVAFAVDDEADTIPGIRAAVRRFVRRFGDCGLVIVDYLQQIQFVGKADNRTQEVGQIAAGLKKLAKQMNVHVMALAQLTRTAEGKEPTLADLRESGTIEAEADMVVFIHRKRQQAGEAPQEVSPTEIIVAKNRNGQTGRLKLGFVHETASYVNMEFALTPPIDITPRNVRGQRENYKADPDDPADS